MPTYVTCPGCGQQQPFDATHPQGRRCARCGAALPDPAVAAGAPVLPAAAPRAEPAWEGPPPGPAPRRPGVVLAAAVIWIVFGSLVLLNFLVSLLILMVFTPPELRGPILGGAFCTGLVVALFGGVFIHVGVRSISGTAKDTLGNGIGSIIFGGLIGGLGLLALMSAGAVRGGNAWGGALQGAINLVVAAALLTAGVLALIGRDGYREWRRYLKALAGPVRR